MSTPLDLCRWMRAKNFTLSARRAWPAIADADFAALTWPRLERTIDFYLGFEARRRSNIKTIKTEPKASSNIDLADGSAFVLTARRTVSS